MAQKKEEVKYPRVEINFSPENPRFQKLADKTRVNIRYSLISPFAFAHIYWDSKISEMVYEVEEPILTEEEMHYKEEIISAMEKMISIGETLERDQMLKLLITELGIDLSYESYRKIYYYLCRDFIGFNEIDPLLRDYYVEDIECNGVNTPIYVVHRMYRNMRTNVIFNDLDKLTNFVEKIAQRSGKYISYANPILDGTLPEGSRVNATYTKDITSKGPTFTIRKFTKIPWTPSELVALETLSPEMLAYLWLLIQYKMNILIIGGTSSGKTTLLNAIAFFIPPESRVVSIEDTRELNLSRENWLPSVERSAIGTTKNIGEVDLFTLLRSSFRQNPDYVIVGEVRGKEAYVLFQGMASGHSSISTIHADSVDTVIKRLETPPIELPPTLVNVLDCVCIMTHAIVNKQETRKLKEIVEILNVDPNGTATTNSPFVWNPKDNNFYFKQNSKIFEKIARRSGLKIETLEMEFRKRSHLMYRFFQKKVFDFKMIQNLINEYYKNPDKVLREFGVI